MSFVRIAWQHRDMVVLCCEPRDESIVVIISFEDDLYADELCLSCHCDSGLG